MRFVVLRKQPWPLLVLLSVACATPAPTSDSGAGHRRDAARADATLSIDAEPPLDAALPLDAPQGIDAAMHDAAPLEPDAPCGTTIEIERSLIVHASNVEDAPILARFSLARVLGALLSTSGLPSDDAARRSLFARWMDASDVAPGRTHATHCDDASITARGFPYTCPRVAVAALATSVADAPSFDFLPVAIVNRFDLAPDDGAHCGEARIVFAKDLHGLPPSAGGPLVPGLRMFLIFEAQIPNPQPEAGISGCRAVLRRWQELSDPTFDSSVRAARLETMFFDGFDARPSTTAYDSASGLRVPLEGDVPATVHVEPFVSASHFAAGTGQIRTNEFLESPWLFREFELASSEEELSFRPVPTSRSPASELFSSSHPDNAAFIDALLENLTGDRLLATDVARLALVTPPRFDAWENGTMAPRLPTFVSAADASTRLRIGEALAGVGSALTVDDLLTRAATQTCAGCHRDAQAGDATLAGRELGGGLRWPSGAGPDGGFTHVGADGSLSTALRTVFLPARERSMETWLTRICGP